MAAGALIFYKVGLMYLVVSIISWLCLMVLLEILNISFPKKEVEHGRKGKGKSRRLSTR
jgi:uncharacterized membrane protein YcaP (DUF421 family)